MTIVMDVRSCMKTTLLAIIILSVVISLSHMYSCIKTFLESLPSVVSAAIAPKCLFIFSNIIVVFLVCESKLSRRRSKLQKIGDGSAARADDTLQDQKHEEDPLTADLRPMTVIGDSKQEQDKKMAQVADEEKDAPVGNEDVHMLIVGDDERETSLGNDDVWMNQCDEKTNHLVLYSIDEVEDGDLELELGGEVSGYGQQERGVEEELEEWELPPADELNRRVEDFIARFNMERQLEEAGMLVCCY